MKRLFSLILTLLLLASVLSGCGKTSNSTDASKKADNNQAVSTEPITLKFMEYTASGSQEETLNNMIKEFEKQNKDIKIQVEVLAYADYFTKLNTVLSSDNSTPDIFELGYENFVTYASKGVLKDLSDTISKDKDFKPSTFKKLEYDAFNYQGKQYGVPEDYSAVVLFYNKTLFDAKGVSYPTASWTWKDELEAAQKLTDAKNGIWGTYSPIQFYEFYKTIAQNGGSIWGPDGKTVTIDNKATADALQWMIDKAKVYKVSPPLNDDTFSQPDADLNAFAAGKIAMLRAGTWNFGKFASMKDKWDIALEPGNTNKAHHVFVDGLVVSNKTKYADAAWKFIKFMSSDDYCVTQRIEKGWSIPTVDNPAVMEAYYKQTPPESKKAVTDALDTLVLPPVGPIPEKWNDLQTVVGAEIDKAKLEQKDVQTALTDAKKKIEELLK